MTKSGSPKTDTTPGRQIHCVRRTHDLLLPRLLSGQIELGES